MRFILLSILIVNLLAGTGLYIYRHSLEKRLRVRTVKQVLKRGQGELPPGFLAEALDLSQDKPTPWDRFSAKEAEKKLMSYPFFRKVKVRKIEPNAVFVDYVLRTPVARVANYTNRVIDEEGAVFPLEPYYSPKRLPAIRFGDKEDSELGFSLMQELKGSRLLLIDLSDAHSDALGRRKIVVVLEEMLFKEGGVVRQPVLLQLSADDPFDSLARWQKIRSLVIDNKDVKISGKNKGLIIDLRLPHLGYIH